MAKVILEPIGTARPEFLDDATWRRQLERMGLLNDALQTQRDEVRDGWGEKYRVRVRAKGKLPSWERLERLRDPDSPILPIGTLVNYGRKFGSEGRSSPGAGVISQRQHRRVGLLVAADSREDPAGAGSGPAPALARGLPRRLLGSVPSRAVGHLSGSGRGRRDLSNEFSAVGRRRAADRRCSR